MSPKLPKYELENSNLCPSLLGQKFFVRFLGEFKKKLYLTPTSLTNFETFSGIMYPTAMTGIAHSIHFHSKGQLISECLLGIIDFPKNQRKISAPVEKFVFWENWRHQKDISKLTDL